MGLGIITGVSVIVGLITSACSSDTPRGLDGGEDAGFPIKDGGPKDGGIPPEDGGIANADGGNPDGGDVYKDGGPPKEDGGPVEDGGPPLEDGGPIEDGGPPPKDGGQFPDGGLIIDGGLVPDGGPIEDGGTPPEDGGLQIEDGGQSIDAGFLDDGGQIPEDGGQIPEDGGIPVEDGGPPPEDGGIPAEDGGVPAEDGGVQAEDGGLPLEDGGPPPLDGGEADAGISENVNVCENNIMFCGVNDENDGGINDISVNLNANNLTPGISEISGFIDEIPTAQDGGFVPVNCVLLCKHKFDLPGQKCRPYFCKTPDGGLPDGGVVDPLAPLRFADRLVFVKQLFPGYNIWKLADDQGDLAEGAAVKISASVYNFGQLYSGYPPNYDPDGGVCEGYHLINTNSCE